MGKRDLKDADSIYTISLWKGLIGIATLRQKHAGSRTVSFYAWRRRWADYHER